MATKNPTPTPKTPQQWIKKISTYILILCVAIWTYNWAYDRMTQKPAAATINYRPVTVCSDAWEKDMNYESFTGKYIDVKLQEGCWGGQITLPKKWTRKWYFQHINENQNSWIAFSWPNPYSPSGPYKGYVTVDLTNHPMKFRLQGEGTVRFYGE